MTPPWKWLQEPLLVSNWHVTQKVCKIRLRSSEKNVNCKGCPPPKKMKKNENIFLTLTIDEETFSTTFVSYDLFSNNPLFLRYCQFLFWNAHEMHKKASIKKISNENIPYNDMTTF